MPFFDNQDTKNFSSTDLVIYNYILNHYQDIPQMRVREIAHEAHASATSVMRFVRKMGFDSFPEFQSALRVKIEEGERREADDFWKRAAQSVEKRTYAADLDENIHILAEKVLASDNIVLIGIGISGILCEYGARRLATLGFNSFSVTDPHYPLRPRLINTTDNLIITISNSGETPDVVDMVAYYQPLLDFERVCITGNGNSTLARISNIVLTHQAPEPRKYGLFDNSSQIPTMLILEKLLEEISNHPDLFKYQSIDR